MNSLQSLTIFIAITRVILAQSQTTPTYWTGPGQYTATSCPTSVCQACPVTQYRSGCGGASAGACVACSTYSALPANAQWTQAGFSGPCPWTCNSGYTLSNGACVAVSNNAYAVSVGLTIPLTASDVESSMSTLLGAVAALSECGTCNFASTPVLCTSCSITATVTQLSSRRRMLTPSTQVVVQVVQLNGQAQAQNTVASISQATLNALLTAQNYPASVTVSTAPTQIVVTYVPPTTNAAIVTTSATATARQTTSKATTVKATTSKLPTTTLPTTTPAPTTAAAATPAPPPPTVPAPVPAASPSPSSSSNSGAVAGGVVGAIVGLIVIGVIIYLVIKGTQRPVVVTQIIQPQTARPTGPPASAATLPTHPPANAAARPTGSFYSFNGTPRFVAANEARPGVPAQAFHSAPPNWRY